MAFEFRLPDIGEGVAEGEVVQWFVHEGDPIKEDAPLVSVLTDKANVEIPSPKAGRVAKIHAQVGEKVKVGGLLVTIDTGSGDPGTAPSEPPARAAAPPPTPASALASPPGPTPGAAPPGAGTDRILASPYLRRLAAERGIDLRSVRGSGPGGRIPTGDHGASSALGSGIPVPSDGARGGGSSTRFPLRSSTCGGARDRPEPDLREWTWR